MITPFGPCEISSRCVAACDGMDLFQGVQVIPRIAGGTQLFWSLKPAVRLSQPEFRLELSRAGHIDADDWEPLTRWQAGVNTFVDEEVHSAGWYLQAHYRIAVRDAQQVVYRSKPVPTQWGNFSNSQRRLIRDVIRREQQLQGRSDSPYIPGLLFKVRYHGEICRDCTDVDSGMVIDDQCESCYGVGYDLGYYSPVCFPVQLSGVPHDLQMYQDQGPFVSGGVTQVMYLNFPQVDPWDVWVDMTTDFRYVIGKIQPVYNQGSLNLVCAAAAARLSFDHPAYQIPLENVAV